MSRWSTRMLALSLALTAACDGLGRPVVDRRYAGRGAPRECERRRPRCDDQLGAPKELDVGFAPRFGEDLPACDLKGQESAPRIKGLLSECTLSLDISQGEEREIADSSLDNVLIQLDGRVRLRIADSTLFRVTLQSAAAVEPDLPPVVQITHTDLRRTALRSELIELTTCYLSTVDLEASELSAVDIEVKESYLRARRATISAANLEATHFGDCDALLLAGSDTINSRFDACTGVTRIYNIEATGCTFDGQLESDDSAFADGRFGVEDATRLVAWNSSVDNTAFCRKADGFRFSAGAIVCSFCQGPLATPDADACFDTAITNLEQNLCKAFEIIHVAAGLPNTCDAFPRRERPIVAL